MIALCNNSSAQITRVLLSPLQICNYTIRAAVVAMAIVDLDHYCNTILNFDSLSYFLHTQLITTLLALNEIKMQCYNHNVCLLQRPVEIIFAGPPTQPQPNHHQLRATEST